MINPLSLVTSGKVVAVALAVGVALGGLGTWRVMSWKEQAATAAVATRTVQQVKLQDAATYIVGAEFEAVRVTIAEDTRNRLNQVENHVSPQADAACPVPLGFVRVWNDAAHGPIPEPTAGPDGAPSGVALSAVGKTHVENAGQYDQIVNQLTSLQNWIRRQQALADK